MKLKLMSSPLNMWSVVIVVAAIVLAGCVPIPMAPDGAAVAATKTTIPAAPMAAAQVSRLMRQLSIAARSAQFRSRNVRHSLHSSIVLMGMSGRITIFGCLRRFLAHRKTGEGGTGLSVRTVM